MNVRIHKARCHNKSRSINYLIPLIALQVLYMLASGISYSCYHSLVDNNVFNPLQIRSGVNHVSVFYNQHIPSPLFMIVMVNFFSCPIIRQIIS